MKKRSKTIIISFVFVLFLNIILLSILTIVQAPYYDTAPSEVNSIYELYASEEYNEVIYRSAREYVSDGDDIQKIEEAFKSAEIVKLNIFESYLRMMLLDENDFVFLTMTRNYGDRKLAMEKLVASNVLVYSENDSVYVVCTELTEYAYEAGYKKIAIYETKNTELSELLTEYKAPKNKGLHLAVPEWRDDISHFPKSLNGRLYVLSFFAEFFVALFVINKFLVKQQKKNDQGLVL